MRGAVLEVQVDTSVWCQQLQIRRLEILSALREKLGEDAPEDLRFRVGYNGPG
jgi:predicted nucleic acid-binding Zn ribbon protein